MTRISIRIQEPDQPDKEIEFPSMALSSALTSVQARIRERERIRIDPLSTFEPDPEVTAWLNDAEAALQKAWNIYAHYETGGTDAQTDDDRSSNRSHGRDEL